MCMVLIAIAATTEGSTSSSSCSLVRAFWSVLSPGVLLPKFSANRDWSIRQLATEAEALLRREYGLAVSTALVLSRSRDAALPFYQVVADLVRADVSGRLPMGIDIFRSNISYTARYFGMDRGGQCANGADETML